MCFERPLWAVGGTGHLCTEEGEEQLPGKVAPHSLSLPKAMHFLQACLQPPVSLPAHWRSVLELGPIAQLLICHCRPPAQDPGPDTSSNPGLCQEPPLGPGSMDVVHRHTSPQPSLCQSQSSLSTIPLFAVLLVGSLVAF